MGVRGLGVGQPVFSKRQRQRAGSPPYSIKTNPFTTSPSTSRFFFIIIFFFYLTFYLAVTNEQQLDYNIICLLFITGTKDTIH